MSQIGWGTCDCGHSEASHRLHKGSRLKCRSRNTLSRCLCSFYSALPPAPPRYAGLAEQVEPSTTTGHIPDPAGVDHPAHYNAHPAGVECIDIIEHMPYNIGAAIKYLWRAGLKPGEAAPKDLRKSAWYCEREAKRLEKMRAK